MNNLKISNLITKNSRKIFILGLYQPEDFYFAHLLEHCLAVDLGKRNIIKILTANIGGGYIFISGDIVDINKVNDIQKNISSYNIDPNSLNHQKKILTTEKLFKDRVHFNRDIYESLETNSSSLEAKDGFYNEFISCEGKRLETKTKTVSESIKWVLLGEDFDQISLKKILNHNPKIQENKFKFFPHETSGDFVFAEIDIEIPSANKTNDFIIYLLNKRIFEKAQDMHIVYGTHTIANDFAGTWNKRSIINYSGYFPREYQDEFFDAVVEEWQDVILSTEDEELIRKLINDYIKNRTIEESIMELFEYGCLIEKGWKHKTDLNTDLLMMQSNLKIHKRTTEA